MSLHSNPAHQVVFESLSWYVKYDHVAPIGLKSKFHPAVSTASNGPYVMNVLYLPQDPSVCLSCDDEVYQTSLTLPAFMLYSALRISDLLVWSVIRKSVHQAYCVFTSFRVGVSLLLGVPEGSFHITQFTSLDWCEHCTLVRSWWIEHEPL